jgi:hypothetical protein
MSHYPAEHAISTHLHTSLQARPCQAEMARGSDSAAATLAEAAAERLDLWTQATRDLRAGQTLPAQLEAQGMLLIWC